MCSWVIEATEKNIAFSFALGAHQFPSNAGEQHCAQCLHALAVFGISK